MEYQSATAFQGMAGWWVDSFASTFDGTGVFVDHRRRKHVELTTTWESVVYTSLIPKVESGWRRGDWRAGDGTTGELSARRYRDEIGELWLCEWQEGDLQSLVWIDAKGAGRDTRTPGRMAWLGETRATEMSERTERAVLRVGEDGVSELVMAFSYEGNPYEVLMRHFEDGWRGNWSLSRGQFKGTLRGRVLRDEKDLCVIGEWVEAGSPITFFAELAYDRDLLGGSP